MSYATTMFNFQQYYNQYIDEMNPKAYADAKDFLKKLYDINPDLPQPGTCIATKDDPDDDAWVEFYFYTRNTEGKLIHYLWVYLEVDGEAWLHVRDFNQIPESDPKFNELIKSITATDDLWSGKINA